LKKVKKKFLFFKIIIIKIKKIAETFNKIVDSSNYILTPELSIKMILINQRIKAKIPTVIIYFF